MKDIVNAVVDEMIDICKQADIKPKSYKEWLKEWHNGSKKAQRDFVVDTLDNLDLPVRGDGSLDLDEERISYQSLAIAVCKEFNVRVCNNDNE